MTNQSKPKILLINRPSKSEQAWRNLQEAADCVVIEQLPHDEQAALIKKTVQEQGPFMAWSGFIDFTRPYPAPFDESLLSPLAQSNPPTRLYVGPGAGYDRVDVPFMTRSGAFYANSPKEVGIRTADGTVALILEVARGFLRQHRSMSAGKWHDRSVIAKDLRSSTVGIVGLGNIGRQVADILSTAFGAKIIYHGRREVKSAPYEYVSLDELLERSDVISLNCPLTPETTGLLGAEQFAKAKDGVLLINTARGKVVVEDELVKALQSGKVLRAGLDVFEDEPNVHPELLTHPNVTLSPHVLALNETILPALDIEMVDNIIQFIKTGKPNTPVNVAELEQLASQKAQP